MTPAIRFFHLLRLWSARLLAAVFMHTPYMPPALLLVWLEWLRNELNPTHPALPLVMREIAEVQEKCRA